MHSDSKSHINYIGVYTTVLLVLLIVNVVGVTCIAYKSENANRREDTIPREVLVFRGYIKYRDLVELANAIRSIVFETLNVTEYSVKKVKVRVLEEDMDSLVMELSHNYRVFRYVNWTALEDDIPLVRDDRFKKLLRMGFFWGYFVSVNDVITWNISVHYTEVGVYNYSYGNTSLYNKVYSLSISPVLLFNFWITMDIRGYKAVSKHVSDYEIARRIADRIFSWYTERLVKLGLNKSIHNKIVLPHKAPYKLDLVNLTPPLPKIYLLLTSSNGTKYLLEIKISNPILDAMAGRVGGRCLIVLVNNSSCLLHIRKEGIRYYLATGKWDPTKVFYENEYKHYLKLIRDINITEVYLPREVIKNSYEPYVQIRTPQVIFFSDVNIDRSLEVIHVNLLLPITIVGVYEFNIPKNIDVSTLFNYINNTCPLINKYVDSLVDVFGEFPPPAFVYATFYNISTVEEFWRLIDELNRTYTDNLSRQLLSYVLKIILFNENLVEAKRTYLFLALWGKSILRRILGDSKRLSEYYIAVPEYGMGNGWSGGSIIYVGSPHLISCVNYTRLMREFWSFIEGVDEKALIKPLPMLQNMGSRDREISSTTSIATIHSAHEENATITLMPKITTITSITGITTNTSGKTVMKTSILTLNSTNASTTYMPNISSMSTSISGNVAMYSKALSAMNITGTASSTSITDTSSSTYVAIAIMILIGVILFAIRYFRRR